MKDNMNNEDIDCAIIIPTYNRPEYLKRLLDYYSQYGGKCRVFVGDSSSEDNKKKNEKFISKITKLDVSHIMYPSDINPYFKTADTLNYVKEKYCALCADDDFITYSGLRMCVDFLMANPDFTCAHGNYFGYCVKKNKKGEIQFFWKPLSTTDSIILPDSEARMAYHFANYSATFYAIHRTEFLKFVFQENMNYTIDYQFGELLPSMLTLIYGKMKKLDVMCNVREMNPNSTNWTCNTLSDFIKDGSYDEKYTKFRECLAQHLVLNSKLNLEEAITHIDRGMAVYLQKFCGGSSLPRKAGIFLENMQLPRSIDHGIRKVYRKAFSIKGFEDWRDSPPMDGNLDEFNRIKDNVIRADGIYESN
jgi:glycosyltransferase domain-containing protein